ncbi:MAG TPA: DUF2637 domain-containing protein [Actinomycetes bacterium]|nr:DUF2637 domain-containing protein [Actinomycetes bacterium]
MPDRPVQHSSRPVQRPYRDRVEVAIDAASWAGTLAIFAYGAALSYQVLHTTALACGLNLTLARAWPLGFESFMAVAAVSVLAEQRARPGRTPWYPWALTALAAGGSIVLNFAHPYLPLDPPPRWLVAAVYGVPPVCAPFAWHLFLLRIAHRHHPHPQDAGQNAADPSGAEQNGDQDAGQDITDARMAAQDGGQDTTDPTAAGPPGGGQPARRAAVLTGAGQDGEPARAVVRALLAQHAQDGLDGSVSWQDVAERTGLSRSRAYALLREERARRL